MKARTKGCFFFSSAMTSGSLLSSTVDDTVGLGMAIQAVELSLGHSSLANSASENGSYWALVYSMTRVAKSANFKFEFIFI
jgi:hypothetical protein